MQLYDEVKVFDNDEMMNTYANIVVGNTLYLNIDMDDIRDIRSRILKIKLVSRINTASERDER